MLWTLAQYRHRRYCGFSTPYRTGPSCIPARHFLPVRGRALSRPPYFRPWFTCLSHDLPTASLASQPYLLRRMPYYTSLLFVRMAKSAPINHYAPRLRILSPCRQFIFAVTDGGPPYFTTHPTLRLNIGPRTAAVASCRSSDFSHGRAVTPV